MKPIPNDLFFAQIESEIAEGKSVIFKVKGNSMYPFLRNGIDSVKLAPVNQKLAKNDVVLFKFNGKHVLHRIIKIEGDKYILQGDGVIKNKEYCSSEDIIGVVTHICREDGKMIAVKSFKWRILPEIWFILRFARRYLLAIIRII